MSLVHPTAQIHSTAIIEVGAEIGEGVSVGPFSVIGPQVRLGRGVRIGSHVVIEGRTSLGEESQVFQFASIGAKPQDLKYSGEESILEIGSHNIVREYVTIQPGTAGGGMKTVVGDRNLFMACSHVAHDVTIGSGNIVANSAAIAGHVVVGDRVVIGGLSGIHQFVRLGDLSMIGAGAMVSKDVPPFAIVQGDRARFVAVNVVGLERAKIGREEIQNIRSLFRKAFFGGISFSSLPEESADLVAKSTLCAQVVEFIKSSERGVVAGRRRRAGDDAEDLD